MADSALQRGKIPARRGPQSVVEKEMLCEENGRRLSERFLSTPASRKKAEEARMGQC